GFHQLFDGKGLGGWKVPDEVKPFWSAEGAHFIAKADPAALHRDLVTEKEYGDFELIADWRLSNKSTQANHSGIQLRGDAKALIPIVGQDESNPKAKKKAAQWNRFHITLKGDRLTVKLNDKLITDSSQLSGIPAKGPISLLNSGEGIEFANIFLKEL
ncbi:MAG: hypothetical protein JWO89_1522, partial [Verrucomicrobiaceae bacterium]|nr:hypothetical protein [Verrucomicrobiaceae bacterium]